MSKTFEKAARLAHEVNRLYALSHGETNVFPQWDDAPDDIKDSAYAGVEYLFANPKASAEDQHNAWCRHRVMSGWTYGSVKDLEAKTHPCLVPYKDLPLQQRLKDEIYQTIVREILEI